MEYIGISLQEYLIRYSGVDPVFISDFIRIQETELTKDYYPFVINMDYVIKWLDINDRKGFRRDLLKNYTNMKDYIVLDESTSKMLMSSKELLKSRNKKIVLLTRESFKKIAIRTKSKNGDQVVSYYIALEDLLIKYQHLIISKLIEENKILKNDLNNELFPVGGMVYVIDLGKGYYKIGYTKDLNKRKKVYDTGMIHRSKVVFWFETDNMKGLETCVLGVLRKYGIKKNKEVFYVELKRIITAIKGCSRTISEVNCVSCNERYTTTNFVKHMKNTHLNLMKGGILKFHLK